MFSRLIQHSRKFWLVALLALSVFGVQVLQASPLHNHAQETVDCALCHLQTLGDDTEVARSLSIAVQHQQALPGSTLTAHYSLHSPAPYQGRAPPFASL
jgi:hypothetical protein